MLDAVTTKGAALRIAAARLAAGFASAFFISASLYARSVSLWTLPACAMLKRPDVIEASSGDSMMDTMS